MEKIPVVIKRKAHPLKCIHCYGDPEQSNVAVLVKLAKKKYLLCLYDRNTKSVTTGHTIHGTDIKHLNSYYDPVNNKFYYITLNYSVVENRHTVNGIGYAAVSNPPLFTSIEPIKWYKDCWDPIRHAYKANFICLLESEYRDIAEVLYTKYPNLYLNANKKQVCGTKHPDNFCPIKRSICV